MTVQHKDIPEAQLHEVKGASVATNKNVLTADGAGSAAFLPAVGITSTEFMDQFSVATSQQPSGTDTPLQIEFGAEKLGTGFIDLATNGTFTVIKTATYAFAFTFNIGRDSGVGTANLFLRGLINGVQDGPSLGISMDSAATIQVVRSRGTRALTAGDVVKIELIRDSSGNDDGGLFLIDPTPATWNSAPTASVTLSEVEGWEALIV